MNIINTISKKLAGKSLYLTGGTGFVGKSIIEFTHRYDIDVRITVLSRNPEKFISSNSHLAKNVELIEGNITKIPITHNNYDYMIHAAATVASANDRNSMYTILSEIISGTQNALEFANKSGVKRFLNISSGAVYGKQPIDADFLSEDYMGSPDTSNSLSAYGEGKRVGELLCAINNDSAGLDYVNARCFAFVGNYLPLDAHLAVGNFIGDGLQGKDIKVKGDGSPLRSYMHSDDLVIWLFVLLLEGKSGESYNVGSDKSYSIKEVAECVSKFFPGCNVVVECEAEIGMSASRYIPSIDKCKKQLGLELQFDLAESVRKTVEYHVNNIAK